MRERILTVPEIALIAGTRAALGAGVALLVSDCLNRDQRKAAGWALFGVGVMSTIPLMMEIISKPSTEMRGVRAA